MSRVSATLVVTLGSFGSEAASLLRSRVRTRRENRPADLALVEVPLEDSEGEPRELPLDSVRERVVEEVRRQLALSALVTREVGDADRPWLDVVVLGDLAEIEARRALIPLIEMIGQVTAARFANLLGRDDRRVVIIPLLALPEAGLPEPTSEGVPPTAEVVKALGDRVRTKVRSFLLETQTSHYLLSRDQLISTAVAMIELLVLAGLRDHPNLAKFLQTGQGSHPDSTGGPFATFGVASVRVEGDLVRSYCRNRSALAVVKAIREGPDLGMAEREAMAREVRIDWEELREELGLAAQSDAAFEKVEKLVIADVPNWPCPSIEPEDTPEEVKDQKFGDDWLRSVGGAIDGLIERFERRRMPELARKVDVGGLSKARSRREAVREVVDEWVWRSPYGWAKARSTLTLLRDEVAATEEEAQQRISDTTLPEMPTPDRLHRPVLTLRDESDRRPRPFRMWLLGGLLALPAVIFAAHILVMLVRLIVALAAPLASAALDLIPMVFAYAATIPLVAAALYFMLAGIVKRRQRELEEVRDDLKRAVEQLITGRKGSVLSYYLTRLELAQDLWVLRIARSERRLLEEELRRLDQIQRALDTLKDQLRASQRSLGVRYPGEGEIEDLSAVEPGGDLILRDAASGSLLEAVYDERADEKDLSERFFDELADEEPPWRGELPMADLRRITKFLDRALELPEAAELLGRGAREEDRAGEAARQGVEGVLGELSTRLSPALGLTAAGEARTTTKHLIAPDAAHELVSMVREALRGEHGEALGGDWEMMSSPRDDGRVYLVVMVTHLPLEGIGAFSS